MSVPELWRVHLKDGAFRLELVGSVGGLLGVGWLFSRAGAWIERRSGTVLSDPVLAHLPAIDITWFIFSVMYAAVLVTLIGLGREPHRLLFGLRVYAGVMLTRLLTIYLTELDDPITAIPLQDPVARLIFQVKTIPTKDLFFSGHTASMFTLYLLARTPRLKRIYILTTLVIGVAVLLQHVHYTFDVFAAPFFAYGVFRLVELWAPEGKLPRKNAPPRGAPMGASSSD
jgi:hypothetical protein